MDNINTDYGIEYKTYKINDNTYMLFPYRLLEGYCAGHTFYDETEHTTLTKKEDLEHESFLVDEVHSRDELCAIYDMDDAGFVKEYFLAEEKDQVLLVQTQNGQITKRKVSIQTFLSDTPVEEYERQKGEPAVTLNGYALDNLLNMSDIETIRTELKRYKSLIASYRDKEKKGGVTKVVVEKGHVKEIESSNRVKTRLTDADMKKYPSGAPLSKSAETVSSDLGGVSLKGLEQHMKERVFGHDEEIRKIAKTILMNYTAQPGEKNESILLIGPTGTGKTETMKAAIDYLDIPLLEINSANLVPQGIKGMSIEDCLYSLIISAGYDLEKAQRGLVFFDEFDKLGESNSDSKAAVVQILLKFIEGDNFMIDKPNDDYNFNTKMLIKIFAGAFSNLFVSKKAIGFGSRTSEEPEFDPRMVTESQYYGKELVTRIPHIFVYHELAREMKKQVLLKSKLSEFLLKKQRYQRQFNVELSAEDSYIEAILERLDSHENSMRDLNNLIIKSLDEAEYEMLSNPNAYKKLILTRECVEDPKKIKLL